MDDNLRERRHNKSLILKTADLNERDFLTGNMYKKVTDCNRLLHA